MPYIIIYCHRAECPDLCDNSSFYYTLKLRDIVNIRGRGSVVTMEDKRKAASK